MKHGVASSKIFTAAIVTAASAAVAMPAAAATSPQHGKTQPNVAASSPAKHHKPKKVPPVSRLRSTVRPTSITLAWKRPKSHAYAGVVIRRTSEPVGATHFGHKKTVARLGKHATKFVDRSITPSTRYDYRLTSRASHHAKVGARSIKVTTPAPAPPSPLRDLTASVTPSNAISLAWAFSETNDVAKVVVRSATSPSPPTTLTSGTLLAQTVGLIDSVTTPALTAGTTYSLSMFVVSAKGKPSQPVSVTLTIPTSASELTGPVVPKATLVGDSMVKLSWTDPPDENFSDVEVQRAQGLVPPSSDSEGTYIATGDQFSTSTIDSSLKPDTFYTYSFFSFPSNGGATAVATLTVLTADAQPSNCTTTWTGAGSNSDWSTPANWSTGKVPGPLDYACIPATAKGLPVQVTDIEFVDRLSNAGGLSVGGGTYVKTPGLSEVATGSLYVGDPDLPSNNSGAFVLTGTLVTDGPFRFSGPHAAQLGGQLQGAGYLAITTTGSAVVDQFLALDATIASAGWLTLDGATVDIGAGGVLANAGLLINDGGGIEGECKTAELAAGEFESSGSITLNDAQVGHGGPFNCLVTEDTGSLTAASGSSSIGGYFTVDSGGSVAIDAGATLETMDNTTFRGNSHLTSSGTLAVESLVSGINLSLPKLDLDGQLETTAAGGGSITVSSDLESPSGSIVYGKLVIAPTAVMNGDLAIYGGDLVNEGVMNLASQGLTITASTATDKGTINLPVGSSIGNACGSLVAPVNGTGYLNVPVGGSIVVGTGAGTAYIGANSYGDGNCIKTKLYGTLTSPEADLALGGSPFEVEPGGVVSGPTTATLQTQGLQLDSGDVVTNFDTLDDTGGFSAAYDTSWPNVEVSGAVSGTGNLTATASLTTSRRATLDGPGSVMIPAAATAVISDLTVSGGALDSHGSTALTSQAYLTIAPGAIVDNHGTMTVADGVQIEGDCVNPNQSSLQLAPGTLNNSGTLTIDATNDAPAAVGLPNESGSTYQQCLVLDDTGTVAVAAGTVDLAGHPATFESGSTFTTDPPSTLDVEGRAIVDDGATTSLPGSITVQGDLRLEQALSLPDLTLDGGTLDGSGDLSVTDTFDSSYGSYTSPTLATTGTTTLAGSATSTLGYLELADGTLVNDGGTTDDSQEVVVDPGAEFDNDGTLNLAGYSSISGGCPTTGDNTPAGTFTNSGAIDVAATANNSVFIGGQESGDVTDDCLTFTDDAATTVSSGTLVLAGDTTVGPAATIGGDPNAAVQTEGSVEVENGAAISGIGSVVNAGTLQLDGSASLPALTSSGTVSLAPSAAITTTGLTLTGGEVDLHATGAGTFGEITASGTTSAANAALQLITGGYQPDCGTTVTAIGADSVSAGFASVAGPTTSGETWQPDTTATTAGGQLSC